MQIPLFYEGCTTFNLLAHESTTTTTTTIAELQAEAGAITHPKLVTQTNNLKTTTTLCLLPASPRLSIPQHTDTWDILIDSPK